jgi:plasmid stability protein
MLGMQAMPNLIVRKLEPEIIKTRKQRTACNGESAEIEHRAIFAEVLATMPNVGQDSDFGRIQGKQEVNPFT